MDSVRNLCINRDITLYPRFSESKNLDERTCNVLVSPLLPVYFAPFLSNIRGWNRIFTQLKVDATLILVKLLLPDMVFELHTDGFPLKQNMMVVSSHRISGV